MVCSNDECLVLKKVESLDYVLLTHLDCDHANGLKLVCSAKCILVAEEEMQGATSREGNAPIRFQRRWWSSTRIETFQWNAAEGPDWLITTLMFVLGQSNSDNSLPCLFNPPLTSAQH